MPKTKEEILADIAKAVEGQGNQGATAIAPILKDIVELAGEGGGGSTPNVIRATTTDGTTYTIENPDDLAGFAAKAALGESVMLIITTVGGSNCLPVYYSNTGAETLVYSQTAVREDTIYNVLFTIDIEARSLGVVNTNITVPA